MKHPIVSDFYFTYDIENWSDVKSSLKAILKTNLEHNTEGNLNNFYSDRNVERDYTQNLVEAIRDPLNQFAEDIDAKTLTVVDSWVVSYMKGGFQSPHSHSTSKYSACLYYGFDNNEHEGTRLIVSPYSSEANGTGILTPVAREGLLLIYPSNTLHFSTPNQSENPRTLICFDINT